MCLKESMLAKPLIHIICHYWYFLNGDFRFQVKVCDGYHGFRRKAMNFNKR